MTDRSAYDPFSPPPAAPVELTPAAAEILTLSDPVEVVVELDPVVAVEPDPVEPEVVADHEESPNV